MQNARESAIRDWLVDTLPEIGGPALVIHEDKRMRRLIWREHLDEVVVLATTRAVLVFAEERGLTPISGGCMERDHQAGERSQSEARRAGDTPDGRTLTILRRYASGEISARQAAPDTCSVIYTALVNASVWCSMTTDGVRA